MTQTILTPEAAATQREWEAFGEQPVTLGPLTDEPQERRSLAEIIADYRRARLVAWALGLVE